MLTWIKKLFTKQTRELKQMKFDIAVYDIDIDDSGRTNRKKSFQNGVMASSVKELNDLFTSCGQEIEILRKYENEPTQPPTKLSEPTTKLVIQPTQIQQPTIKQEVEIPQSLTFSVGGIECKCENGKVYQKQWVRMSDEETVGYRLVMDSTNKIVNINGKHFEVNRWISVKDDDSKELK